MSPEQIGRYVILRTLGRGAMGIVYLARDPQIERELALKTIRFDTAEKSFGAEEAKARFLKEARISGRLQHPHIVTVFDVGEDSGTLFLAMELVQGGSFSQRLADPAGFAIRDRIRVVAEVAEALAHAHERGVLHRDVKPANILLSPTLSAKVTDFGIGKLLTGDTELTSTGQMVGSPAYMSPEQIKGEKLDARTDIFSLGIVLYQALTLRKPFPADTLTTLVYQILHEEPPDPSLVSSDVPESMREIIRKCLAKDRANRYADAGELADDLREALGFSPVGSTAGFSDSKVRKARPSGTHPPVAPLTGPPAAPPGVLATNAPTEAMRLNVPVGKSKENAATSAPTVASMPAIPAPDPNSESPTITTGRRMGEAVAAVKASAAPPRAPAGKKKGLSPLVLGGALLAVVAVVLGVLSLSKKGDKELDGTTPVPTGSIPAVAPMAPGTGTPASRPPEAPSPLAPLPATAGPAVAVVETPVPEIPPTAVPLKRTRVRPAAATPETAPPVAVPTASRVVKPAQKPADLTVTIRRFLKIDVSPDQARVYLDGRYIGISDDWDDSGGGSLLAFNLEGTHRLRICAAEHRDLIVDLIVRSTATDDKVTIDNKLEKGTPEGPTGPEGKLKRPSYKTVGGAVFNVEPPDAMVTVNGRDYGSVSRLKDGIQFQDMAVYEVLLTAPGYESKSVRVLVGPTAGEVRANIREKLKKM